MPSDLPFVVDAILAAAATNTTRHSATAAAAEAVVRRGDDDHDERVEEECAGWGGDRCERRIYLDAHGSAGAIYQHRRDRGH